MDCEDLFAVELEEFLDLVQEVCALTECIGNYAEDQIGDLYFLDWIDPLSEHLHNQSLFSWFMT